MILVSSSPPVKLVYLDIISVICNKADHCSGVTMEPVSWQEMRCPKTGRIEKRKCAKPENL